MLIIAPQQSKRLETPCSMKYYVLICNLDVYSNRYPWVVKMFHECRFLKVSLIDINCLGDGFKWCAGTLITKNYVLTALHCATNEHLVLAFGVDNIDHSWFIRTEKSSWDTVFPNYQLRKGQYGQQSGSNIGCCRFTYLQSL